MNDKDKLRFLVKQLIPSHKVEFWTWFEDKFMKYGGQADTIDMTLLGESLRVAQAELTNDSHETLKWKGRCKVALEVVDELSTTGLQTYWKEGDQWLKEINRK